MEKKLVRAAYTTRPGSIALSSRSLYFQVESTVQMVQSELYPIVLQCWLITAANSTYSLPDNYILSDAPFITV